MFKFNFCFIDNSGFRKSFIIKAKDKAEAINKGFKKADRMKKGDIVNWTIALRF